MIADFNFFKEKDVLEWICYIRSVRLSIPCLALAMVDSTRQLVFALSEPKPLPTVLTIFNAQGEKLFWSAPPEGAFFGNDSNLLIVFYVQIMPDDFVMQLHRF